MISANKRRTGVGPSRPPPSHDTVSPQSTLPRGPSGTSLASRTASTSGSHFSNHKSFITSAKLGGEKQHLKVGDGVPGFRTSFNVSGKGGGAFRPISENFAVSPANGTLSLSLPIQSSPARGGFGPELSLAYSSGSGNGPYGFGWGVNLPAVSRKTSEGIPHYGDSDDDMTFSGMDIVSKLKSNGSLNVRDESGFEVTSYRPRFDPQGLRIERWANTEDPVEVHWRIISSDNVTSIYGLDDSSRIVDTSGSVRRIFSWLLCRSYDGSGNAIEYLYKPEDDEGIKQDGILPIWEKNRPVDVISRQRYIKKIKYGNRTPCRGLKDWDTLTWPQEWTFEVVFDYGEHNLESPDIAGTQPWFARKDAFSQGNSGFEVRTYRLCRRVLMFHHFPEETGLLESLVSSTEFSYNETEQGAFLSQLVMKGHSLDQKGTDTSPPTYLAESLPPWTFDYTTTPKPNQLKATRAKVANLLRIPGLGSSVSEWLDLDGEGVPGLLTRLEDNTMCYQRNLGSAIFDPDTTFQSPQALIQQPALQMTRGGRFDDLDRNGHLDFVAVDAHGRPQGYWERGDSDSWSEYSEFPETPTGDAQSDVAVSIDLTGDGQADVLRSYGESGELMWQRNLGKQGFSGSQRSFSFSVNTPPRLSQTSIAQTHVADMTGDGLADLVEISAERITYWPNLGHGAFGTAVEMGNPPVFGENIEFNQARLRLIDVDGSGTTDLLYLLPDGGAHLYYNLAGNRWSKRTFILSLPRTVDPNSVFMLDILGQGTACLCWSETSISGETNIRYLDLMGGTKPHLLKGYANGLGASTSVSYAPSTKFFLEDQTKGQPWTTKLPFPVQCVASTKVMDQITGNSVLTEYSYHDGYYDPNEKTFSGFGMVETWQSEVIVLGKDERLETPKAYTKSWFNLGNSLKVEQGQFHMPSQVSSSLYATCDKDRDQALVGLKGSSVRTEVYTLDGSERENVPYSVEEMSYDVRQLQPRSANKYAVFQVLPRASVSTQLDRQQDDHRITHDIVLKTNEFGAVEELLSIVYPRSSSTLPIDSHPEVAKNQAAGNVSFTKAWYTNSVDEDHCFRNPLAWRHQDFEVLRFSFDGMVDVDVIRGYDFNSLSSTKTESTYKALRSENRAYFRDSQLLKSLPGGKLEAYSLLDRMCSLAFTPDILSKLRNNQKEHGINISLEEHLKQGGHIQLEDDAEGNWWTSSGQARFSQADDQLQKARSSFYTPTLFVDVFGNTSTATMDAYYLLVEQVRDALGNTMSFGNDYHHLQAVRITDHNNNIQQASLDALGRPIGFAMAGKALESQDGVDGDSLEPPTSTSVNTVLTVLSNPSGEECKKLLGKAGGCTVYCLDQASSTAAPLSPAFLLEISRDLSFRRSENPTLHVSVTYLNGHGAPIQQIHLNDLENKNEGWLVSGASVSDASGQVRRTFAPFFAPTPGFTPVSGISSNATTIFYDGIGRPVAQIHPDHTWSKTVHSPWMTTDYSVADMISVTTPQDDADVGPFFHRINSSWSLPTWSQMNLKGTKQQQQASVKSSAYGVNPTTTHFGCCGLPVKTVQVVEGKVHSHTFYYDFSGNKIRDIDSLGRLCEVSAYDKLDRRVLVQGMDDGDSASIQDVNGSTLISWNSRGVSLRHTYDALRRETGQWMQRGSEAARLIVQIIHGEYAPEASERNLKGQVWTIRDQSGKHVNSRFDIRGRCVEKTFSTAKEYRLVLDWNTSPSALDAMCEPEIFTHKVQLDNFDQVLEEEDPKGNRTLRKFALSGHVKQVTHRHVDIPGEKIYLQDSVYSADGIPLKMVYGNQTSTEFRYDELSRHLISQKTTLKDSNRVTVLEDLTHAYDCAGRCVYTYDASEQTKYFRNSRIEPKREYTYDAIGQLISASGRALLPSTGILRPYNATTGMDPTKGVVDGQQVYQYLESYEYDLAGNIQKMTHAAIKQPKASQWTRRYFYHSPSRLSTDSNVQMSNRLTGTVAGSVTEDYGYSGDGGQVGCMTSLPQYSQLSWNFQNLLGSSSTQWTKDDTPQTTYYVYDYTGKRVRKVTESFAKAGSPTRKERDTLYLDGLEIQVKLVANNDICQRTITQVTGHQALALVESATGEKTLRRYQVGDDMELDDHGQLISYEEYSPFGAVTYSSMHQDVNASRDYRFQRYKHDRETGLYHCGARYYCPWLGRWTSPDPSGDIDGPNLYQYVNNDPVNFDDHTGRSRKQHGRSIFPPLKDNVADLYKKFFSIGKPVNPRTGGVDSDDAPTSKSFISSIKEEIGYDGFQKKKQEKLTNTVNNVKPYGLSFLGERGERRRVKAKEYNEEASQLQSNYDNDHRQYNNQASSVHALFEGQLNNQLPDTIDRIRPLYEPLQTAYIRLTEGGGTSNIRSTRFDAMEAYTYAFSRVVGVLQGAKTKDNGGGDVNWVECLDMLKHFQTRAKNTAPKLDMSKERANSMNGRLQKEVGNVCRSIGGTRLGALREGHNLMEKQHQPVIHVQGRSGSVNRYNRRIVVPGKPF
ncbi:hypothetical protein ACHAPT_008834 [Fusarium lateritium]